MSLSRNSSIGLVLVVVAAAVLGWSLVGKPNPLSEPTIVWAEFQDVSTIAKFDRDVRIAGVNVGTVGAIERHGDIARIELRLRDDAVDAIRADATAELRPHTLFDGSAFVEVYPGSPTAAPISPAGIPLARTRGYVSLDKALRTFDGRLRGATGPLVRDLRAALSPGAVQSLRQSISRAPALVRPAAVAARALQGTTRRELAASVRGFAQTADGLARARDHIGPLVRSSATTLTAVNTADSSLDATLSALPATLDDTQTGAVALQRTLVALRPAATDLAPALTSTRRTLLAVRPLLSQLPPVLRRVRPLVAGLDSTLRAGARAAPDATVVLRRLRPALSVIQHTLLPFLREKMATGATIGRGLASVASSATGTLSPVKTVAEGGKAGAGHVFYQLSDPGTQVACSQVPEPVVAIFKELQLCTP